ncbi:D-alanyl-D-alanine carboxypeptidase [Anaerovirgula multivorans]|uniref:D-alanyl-D-alanine carboxypeptidase n=1 Tax=Anaerovirgula multivorans TaxID=312168 RepID=A0A239D7G6_9FIRM|nr:M15 family metallopeptidase [Anaerovirgula multivorans]SNS27958.1 D-alanyl-D-alanine carboxypeptidase [Anaerovirgula multivorans]
MKKYIVILIFILLGMFGVKTIFLFGKTAEKVSITSNEEYGKTLRKDLFSLMMAYPEYIVDIKVVDNNQVYLILKSGKRLLYDDRKEKNELEKLENPDLQDMLSQEYFLGSIDALMPQDYNPGRIRVYPLLKEVYGANQLEIEKNLTGIRINSSHHRFNGNNSAADFLNHAITELNKRANNNPELWSYLYPIGGTYNFRYIAQTNRLSPHSFGISIDLSSNPNDYWQWTTRATGEKRLKNYPEAIVNVMESNYFIWGGKWGQFDIFHFEYRPEIIIKALYFANEEKDLWYENLPVENTGVSEAIWLIEERLQHLSSPNGTD